MIEPTAGVSASRPTLEARVTAVRHLVAEGEIDLAIRRLLDLARDFAGRELRNEVMVLSGKHKTLTVDVRQFGKTLEINRDRDVLMSRTLELVDLVEKAAITDMHDEAWVAPSMGGVPAAGPGMPVAPAPSSPFAEAKRVFLARERESMAARETQVPVCRCERLGRTYKSAVTLFALHDVNLDLMIGRITGVVGGNGHGKTTLLRLIAGDLEHTAGTLTYPLLTSENGLQWTRIKSAIVYVPQSNPSWGDATLETSLRFTAAMFGRTGAANDDEVEFMLHRLGLQKEVAALFWTKNRAALDGELLQRNGDNANAKE